MQNLGFVLMFLCVLDRYISCTGEAVLPVNLDESNYHENNC
jgi:hypothetical protein